MLPNTFLCASVHMPDQHRLLNKILTKLRKDCPQFFWSKIFGQILLISKCNLVPNPDKGGRMVYIPTEPPFCIPPLLVGCARNTHQSSKRKIRVKKEGKNKKRVPESMPAIRVSNPRVGNSVMH